ncbi:unnamed protein product [Tilletia caries]|nr:unnamed protein product [Tilletia caries]
MGIYTFKVQGQVCYQIGSLIPAPDTAPAFAQVYFGDTDTETELRMRLTASASPTHIETGAIIRKALDWVNPYVSFLRHVRSDLEAPLAAGHYVSIHMLQPDPVNGPDPRRYNRPTAAEVAAVVVNLSPTSTSGRDIIITYNDGLRRHVNEQHRSFLALRFPILNPYGQSATSAGTTRSRWVVTLLKNYFPQTQSYMPPLLLIQILSLDAAVAAHTECPLSDFMRSIYTFGQLSARYCTPKRSCRSILSTLGSLSKGTGSSSYALIKLRFVRICTMDFKMPP